MKYEINFLPARYGDCIWIEYGTLESTKYILIDGGTSGTKKHIKEILEDLPKEKRIIELLVVTHIDRDHIGGILSLLEEKDLPCEIKSIWFNGWMHLHNNSSVEPFGAVQGERLTAAILKHKILWNSHFQGGPVVVTQDEPLPKIVLDGGMEIILLSPKKEHLIALRGSWESDVRDAGLDPGFGAPVIVNTGRAQSFGIPVIPDVNKLITEKFYEDTAVANGSSIAFIAKFGGKTALLAADSFPGVISRSLERLEEDVPLDLVKISHHGSKGNTSPELIQQLNCSHFVISTSGTVNHHPDAVTIARLITLKDKPKIIFNYKSNDNKVWELKDLQQKFGYTTQYPSSEGVSVNLFEKPD